MVRICKFSVVLYTIITLFTLPLFASEFKPATTSLTSNEQQLIDNDFIYIETDKDLSISEVMSNRQLIDWQDISANQALMLDHQQAYWFVFRLSNASAESQFRYLVLAETTLEFAQLYGLDLTNRPSLIAEAGFSQSLEQRELADSKLTFPISLKPAESKTFLLRVEHDAFFKTELRLWQAKALIQHNSILNIAVGCFLGVLLIMSLYALMVFKATRDICFVFYAGFCICFLVFYAGYSGVIQHLWPTKSLVVLKQATLVCLALAASLVCWFNIHFHQIKPQQILLHKLFSVLAITGILMASTVWLFPHVVQLGILVFLVISCCLVSLYAALSAWKNTIEHSLNVVIAWSILLFVAVVTSAELSGLAANIKRVDYFIVLTHFVSFSLLFGNLMHRVKSSQLQSLTAKEKAMQHYRMFHDIYQHAVEAHYTTTEHGEIVRVNAAFVEVLGYDSYHQLVDENPNIADFYLELKDREALLKRAKQEQKVLGYQSQWRRRDGRNIWVSINLRYEEGTMDGNVLIGSFMDVTESKRAERQLEFMATHDSLTGLLNRREFEKRLNAALIDCDENTSHTLLYMDLDQFKVVNDTCGHKAGDILLRQLTEELRDVMDDKNTIARLGGDEFGVLLYDMVDDEAFVYAYKLKQVVQDFRFVWDRRVFTIGISIGMVEINDAYLSIDEVLSIADTACFTAKEKGRNRIHSYSESDEDVKRHHAEMERVTQINQALEANAFYLEYQTIYSIHHVEGLHYELLIRMKGPDGSVVSPGEFLPAAERYNLMSHIDRWVINHYFNWLAMHPEHMDKLDKASINLSGPSLADEDMQMYILQAFERYHIPYNKICFEITESLAITQLDRTLSFIKTFKGLGCKFSLDDFGSGFSSYGYLKNLPVDYLKIDGSFVKDMLLDPIDRAMVKSINEVAKAIGMVTIAEFVESEEILAELKEIGVDYAQGYVINRPQALSNLIE
ncbi:EAL domain-containing protein [Catenovulum sp. SM1970]|uniref:EAL domain-containing protein n=1 Tax=Marinifaba aquimaris TaxID=2741323 RepID=UPI001573760C|nr:EAL domain-containing protein [Marinifaba aquimaris]NTS77218.1 EAL domain-containing protein [Marinifaba aquimaris]